MGAEIPTTTAGGLWGAYLMIILFYTKVYYTVLYYIYYIYSRAIKSVKQSSNLSYRKLKGVRVLHFCTFCLKPERIKRSQLSVGGYGG